MSDELHEKTLSMKENKESILRIEKSRSLEKLLVHSLKRSLSSGKCKILSMVCAVMRESGKAVAIYGPAKRKMEEAIDIQVNMLRSGHYNDADNPTALIPRGVGQSWSWAIREQAAVIPRMALTPVVLPFIPAHKVLVHTLKLLLRSGKCKILPLFCAVMRESGMPVVIHDPGNRKMVEEIDIQVNMLRSGFYNDTDNPPAVMSRGVGRSYFICEDVGVIPAYKEDDDDDDDPVTSLEWCD
jgi:hypothetical protein